MQSGSAVLADSNLWVAAVFDQHPAHGRAQQRLLAATAAQPLVFCRATEQSFLRLVTTPAIHKACGVALLSNSDALAALGALQALPQVRVREEAPGTAVRWHQLAHLPSASPKLWMDAYLAGFSLAAGLALASFDGDFHQFTRYGLNFEHLQMSA